MSRSSVVVRPAIPVWQVRAVGGPAGAKDAFAKLEAALPTLEGRKFFGTFREGDYHACVARIEGEDLAAKGLEPAVLAGGAYAQRPLEGGYENIGKTMDEMGKEHRFDATRPEVEWYRSEGELILLLPVLDAPTA